MDRSPRLDPNLAMRRLLARLGKQDRNRLTASLEEANRVSDALQELAGESDRTRIRDIIERCPQLLSDEADRQLYFCVQSVDQDRSEFERLLAEVFDTLRTLLLSIRVHGLKVLDDSDSLHPPDPLSRAALLARVGRPEEAITEVEAVRRAAAEAGDLVGVGEADLMYCSAYQELHGSGPERMRIMRERCVSAESAFRSVGDRDGLLRTLIRQIGLLVEDHDGDRLEYTLAKLDKVDPDIARWWRRYAFGLLAVPDDLDSALDALSWCRDEVALLGSWQQDHWRGECQRKLDIISGTVTPRPPPSGLRNQILAAMSAVDKGGRLGEVLDGAEELRMSICSEVKQRELSAFLENTYLLAALAAEKAGDVERAADLRERNTSRALLSRGLMSLLWGQSEKQSFEELADINVELIRARNVYASTGRDSDLQLLRYWLGRRREINTTVEERVRAARPLSLDREFSPVTCARLAGSLADGDVVVQYGQDGAITVIKRSEVVSVNRFDPVRMAEVCATYRRLAAHPLPDLDELRTAEEEIAAACLNPLREAVDGLDRLFLIPSGALWGVPLHHPDWPASSVVPSMSVLEQLLQRTLPERRLRRFFGAADPDGSLPYAAAETTKAAACFPDSLVLTSADLRFVSVLANLFDVDIAHLACHGEFFEDFPELSYLHVAGTGIESAWLFCHDLTRLVCNARLAVVAACHAGNGVAMPGNEYVGFPGALLVMGIQTVLAPLWAIDDRSTHAFMRCFYQHYSVAGSAEAALRHARTELQRDPETADPCHWAGFQLFGLT